MGSKEFPDQLRGGNAHTQLIRIRRAAHNYVFRSTLFLFSQIPSAGATRTGKIQGIMHIAHSSHLEKIWHLSVK
jgi:hypothetical protein